MQRVFLLVRLNGEWDKDNFDPSDVLITKTAGKMPVSWFMDLFMDHGGRYEACKKIADAIPETGKWFWMVVKPFLNSEKAEETRWDLAVQNAIYAAENYRI